jgi:hypothetical protein
MKDFAKGKQFYAKQLPSFFEDFGRISPKNLVSELFELYDAIQGEFMDGYGKNISGNLAKKLFNSNAMFFNMHAAEHEVQGSLLFGMLEGKKVNDLKTGKQISLLSAYKKYGIKNISEHVDFSEQDRRDLQNRIHSINKSLNGVYNSFDKGTAQRYSLGRLGIMYRKHVIPGYRRRYKEAYVDQERGDIVEGYHIAFLETFVKDLRNKKFNIANNWKNYSEREKLQIMRTLSETSMILSLAGMIFLIKALAGGDDDDKNQSYVYNFILYQMIRMQSETAAFISPIDAYRVIRTPSAMTTTIERMIKFVDQFLFTWDPEKLEYQKKSGIWEKGDNKSWAQFLKLAGLSGYNLNPDKAVKAFESTFKR